MIPIFIILKKISYRRRSNKFLAEYEANKVKNYGDELLGLIKEIDENK